VTVRVMTRSAWVVMIGCTWLVLLGTVVGGARQNPEGSDGWRIPESAATEQSPVPASPETIARGKQLYQSKCQRCHGPDGTGRGPDADPAHRPADLTDGRRASRNPDGVMFYKIWNGRAKPKMPAMKSDVSVTDAWMIVQYIKTLRKPVLPYLEDPARAR
jgi:mono/diheme cytochrome c family protein